MSAIMSALPLALDPYQLQSRIPAYVPTAVKSSIVKAMPYFPPLTEEEQ